MANEAAAEYLRQLFLIGIEKNLNNAVLRTSDQGSICLLLVTFEFNISLIQRLCLKTCYLFLLSHSQECFDVVDPVNFKAVLTRYDFCLRSSHATFVVRGACRS